MPALVAFLDILGTKERVSNATFSDLESLDFANPVGVAARYSPSLRFAVFSDSVIVSCASEEAAKLVQALAFLYGQWFSDYIFVRGAVAKGEIEWVEHKPVDDMFRNYRNFAYARVYGKALVKAHGLEQRSGPGAICFLSEDAAEVMSKAVANCVLDGLGPMLVWTDKREADTLNNYIDGDLQREPRGTERRRHVTATSYYCKRVLERGLFMPDGFSHSWLK